MRNYLSFGAGVNSVALYLLMVEQGIEFEAVFVNHGTDWPDTYNYMAGFQWWLKSQGFKPVTILNPIKNLRGIKHANLYDYAMTARMVPTTYFRWCTKEWKVLPIMKYYKKPCFNLLGIDAGESHRAKITTTKGVENRYPLIENEIDRDGCIEIIKKHGLPVPMKSGCYICPYQKKSQWVELRNKYPCLFQKAVNLENENIRRMVEKGKKKRFISNRRMPLSEVVESRQGVLFEQDEYPPCLCGL